MYTQLGPTGPAGPTGQKGDTGPAGDYVISIRGLTGAVGLTNGSGIGLSVSGNTLTVSNTGVLNIDGSTGAISNVARTNIGNTWTASQDYGFFTVSAFNFRTETFSTQTTSASPGIISIRDLDNNIPVQSGFELYHQPSSEDTYRTIVKINEVFDNTEVLLPSESGTLALTKDVVISFNGLTGSVTGVTTGTANTFVALQSFSAGISASGLVVLAQGVCGGYGNDVQSYGYTSGYDIIPTNWQSISANISSSPNVNSLYLAPINISKKSIIKSVATQRGTDTTGNTGNIYLALYDSNLYGLPNRLVYSSPSTALGTGNFGVNRISNVNYTANPGAYWLGIIFSATVLSSGLARYGGSSTKLVTPSSSSPVAQSTVTGLTAATSGFTLPTSLNNVSLTNVIGNNFPAVFFTAEGAT
jgi:hypothetical protein